MVILWLLLLPNQEALAVIPPTPLNLMKDLLLRKSKVASIFLMVANQNRLEFQKQLGTGTGRLPDHYFNSSLLVSEIDTNLSLSRYLATFSSCV